MLKLMGKKIFTFYGNNFCLSKRDVSLIELECKSSLPLSVEHLYQFFSLQWSRPVSIQIFIYTSFIFMGTCAHHHLGIDCSLQIYIKLTCVLIHSEQRHNA